jgi:hypothetical protein
MKKRMISAICVVSFLLGTAFVINAEAKKLGTQSLCLVSSTPEHNVGHCRALSGGGGDKCYSSGSGPACTSTVTVEIPDPILPGNG